MTTTVAAALTQTLSELAFVEDNLCPTYLLTPKLVELMIVLAVAKEHFSEAPIHVRGLVNQCLLRWRFVQLPSYVRHQRVPHFKVQKPRRVRMTLRTFTLSERSTSLDHDHRPRLDHVAFAHGTALRTGGNKRPSIFERSRGDRG